MEICCKTDQLSAENAAIQNADRITGIKQTVRHEVVDFVLQVQQQAKTTRVIPSSPVC